MSFTEIERLIDRYDTATSALDQAVTDRLSKSMDASFRQMVQELERQYPTWQSEGSLYASQRRLLLLQELGPLLAIVRPEDAEQYQKLMQDALQLSHTTGATLADELVRVRDPGYPLQEFATIPIEAAAAQARDGVQRLYRYSDEFRTAASGIVEQGLIQGWGTKRVQGVLERELGVAKGKAETLARTEVMSALNTASQERYQANGLMVQVFNSPSERLCSFCLARHGNVYEVGQVSVPFHPRCRDYLAPFSPKWQERGLTDDAAIAADKTARIAEMEAQGVRPNAGPTYWEKKAGLAEAPAPVWKPGDAPLPPVARPKTERAFGLMNEVGFKSVDAKGLDTKRIQSEITAARKAYQAAEGAADAKILALGPNGYKSPEWKEFMRLRNVIAELEPLEQVAIVLDKGRAAAGQSAIDRLAAGADTPEIQNLRKATADADKAAEAAFQTAADPFSTPEWKSFIALSNQLKTAESEAELAPMRDLREKLLRRSTQDEARATAGQVKLLKSATNLYGEDALKDALTEFYQLTNGKGGSLKSLGVKEARAYADTDRKYVNMGKGEDAIDTMRTLYHEIGHILEVENPQIAKAMIGWRDSRATGEARPINEIDPGAGYDAGEMARPGRYSNPYIGKVYNYDATEVLAVGLQHFATPEDMLLLYKRDPEHFFLVLGALQ